MLRSNFNITLRQNGYIFFIILVFIQIFSLSTFIVWLNVSLSIKALSNDSCHGQLVDRIKHIMSIIEKSMDNSLPSECLKNIDAVDIQNYPESWWRKYGCIWPDKDKAHYYFFIEDMGVDECAKIVNTNDLSSHYYRLSLALFLNSEQADKLFFQSTFVVAEKQKLLCQNLSFNLQKRRQTFIEL